MSDPSPNPIDSQIAALKSLMADSRAQLEEYAAEHGIDLAAFSDPPVTIACGFDGAISAVSFRADARAAMTSPELVEALHEASRHPRYVPPPPPEGQSRQEHWAAVAAQTYAIIDQADRLGASLSAFDSAPEVRASNGGKTVSVTYRGRRLTDLTVQSTWAGVASEADIQQAAVEASQAALQTVSLTERRQR